jgi:hypothetical protein
MDFATFLEQTEPADVIVDVTMPDGSKVCSLTLRPCDRTALDVLRKQATRQVVNAKTRAVEDKVDDGRLREGLIRQCVVGWDGMTFGSAALAMGRRAKNGAGAMTDTALPFEIGTAVRVLGAVIGIEDVIWTASLQRVEAEAQAEAVAKND